MKNIFQSIATRRPKKSVFDLTHNRKFSFQPGLLYPTLNEEILPGDHWSFDTSALVRFQPMISPVMHQVDVCSYSFFVPCRLTMQRGGFETFITGGPRGDGQDYAGNTIIPPMCWFSDAGSSASSINVNNIIQGTLADYLGIQFGDASGAGAIRLNVMEFIAFWLIWNENFRDQNLSPDYVNKYPGIFQSQGDITPAIYAAMTDVSDPFDFWNLPHVCWEKDLFTSALPFAQRGQPVETPLSGTAQVTYLDPSQVIKTSTANAGHLVAGTGTQPPVVFEEDVTGTNQPVQIRNIDSVELTSGGFTINALRLAARLQEWLEKMARGGSRYVEQILQMWGVVSSDARLQRPEYLGGGKLPVHISEVLQTSENGSTPIAEMAGHGVAAGKQHGWSKTFEEHGFVMSFIFLRPKTAYQQGTRRKFTNRFDKLDWAWPQFAHLGEQTVLTSELYTTMNLAVNNTEFGYQQRYAEYKYIPSTVHGEFRISLNHWQWGRIFAAVPELNQGFVRCDPDPRIFNVIDTTDPLYCIVTNKITAVRPLPYYGEPTL